MINRQVSFPRDEQGFFRWECPLCCREFKVLLKDDELGQIAQSSIEDFLIEKGVHDRSDDEESEEPQEFFCPYCGQSAPSDHWWTQEQLAYIQVIAQNIMADLVNEQLIRPLNRSMGHGSFIRFEGKEMKKQDEWISPEASDMTVFNLPCCERQIKVADDWKGTIHCFFCGFAYGNTANKQPE